MAKQVLVIDDDAALRLLYERQLSSSGYEVHTVADGPAGLAAAEATSYDVIILDVEMPELDGLQVLHLLRKVAPGSRILLNSAYDIYRHDFQSWLADGYLVKSSNIQPLIDKLRELVDKV